MPQEGAAFPLSPMASQRGLAWLKPETLRLQLSASNGGNARIPLGSATVSVAGACRAAAAHIVPPTCAEGTAWTAALEVVAPLSAFGCYAGEVTLGLRFRISAEAAAEAAEALAREGRRVRERRTDPTDADAERTRHHSPAGARWRSGAACRRSHGGWSEAAPGPADHSALSAGPAALKAQRESLHTRERRKRPCGPRRDHAARLGAPSGGGVSSPNQQERRLSAEHQQRGLLARRRPCTLREYQGYYRTGALLPAGTRHVHSATASKVSLTATWQLHCAG